MNKILRAVILSTLSLFAFFVVSVSFAHLYEIVLGNSTYGWFEILDLYLPAIAGLAACILTILTVILTYRSTLLKYSKLFLSLSLIFLSAVCITFVGNSIANKVFFGQNDHSDYDMYVHYIVRPKVVTVFVLFFLILSIVSFVLLFVTKTIPVHRPTKAERMQAQIDELQKQIDELKKDE